MFPKRGDRLPLRFIAGPDSPVRTFLKRVVHGVSIQDLTKAEGNTDDNNQLSMWVNSPQENLQTFSTQVPDPNHPAAVYHIYAGTIHLNPPEQARFSRFSLCVNDERQRY